jgi:hypothetical protein
MCWLSASIKNNLHTRHGFDACNPSIQKAGGWRIPSPVWATKGDPVSTPSLAKIKKRLMFTVGSVLPLTSAYELGELEKENDSTSDQRPTNGIP